VTLPDLPDLPDLPELPDLPGRADQPAHPTNHARRGRRSAAKRRLLDEVAPRFTLGDREWPAVVDLGCGTGETALHLARSHPNLLVLAVDVHTASLATLLREVDHNGPANLRVHHGDGVELLRTVIRPGTVQLLTVLFPDPWPKARHRHRRLIQPRFAALAADRLAAGGVVRLATDRADYATQMRAVLGALCDLRRVESEHLDERPVTFYEAKARSAGRTVHELAYGKLPRPPGATDVSG
jgi:tRNA (guanine-N7-)-methyltransferase